MHESSGKKEDLKIAALVYSNRVFTEKIVSSYDEIKKICNQYKLDSSIGEIISKRELRPILKDFGNYIYMSLKFFSYERENDEINSARIDFVLGQSSSIIFSEGKEDVSKLIIDSTSARKNNSKKINSSHVLCSVIDLITDNLFKILEQLEDNIEKVENDLLADSAPEDLHKIKLLERKMSMLHTSIWPLRDIVSALQRSKTRLIKNETIDYLKGAYDHIIQIIDILQLYRETTSTMLYLYISNNNNKMTEIMKVLTVISTIFIPLTFIVGVYGMNFKHMPELEWELGYPIVTVIMVIIGILMLISFKKRKWV